MLVINFTLLCGSEPGSSSPTEFPAHCEQGVRKMKALSLLQEPHTWALVEPPPSMEHRSQYLLQGCEADPLSQIF